MGAGGSIYLRSVLPIAIMEKHAHKMVEVVIVKKVKIIERMIRHGYVTNSYLNLFGCAE